MNEWDPKTQPPAYGPLIAPVTRQLASTMGWLTAAFAVGLFSILMVICGTF